MGVYSDGSYNVPAGLIYSFPVTCCAGEWKIVQGNNHALWQNALALWNLHCFLRIFNLFIFLLFKKVISDFCMETMNFANNCEDSYAFCFFFLLFFIPNNSWMAKYMICFTSFFFFFFILGMFGLQVLLIFDEWRMFRIGTWIWFTELLCDLLYAILFCFLDSGDFFDCVIDRWKWDVVPMFWLNLFFLVHLNWTYET